MKRLPSILLFLLVMLLSGSLIAQGKSAFPLGVYSYLRSHDQTFTPHNDFICSKMQELGYNLSVIETTNADTDAELNTLLRTLDKYGVSAILLDRTYSPNPDDLKHYSVYCLTTSNYLKLEAEYKSEQEVNKGDGRDIRYWYASRDISKALPRIGTAVSDKSASNKKVWLCRSKKDKPGYAYLDIRYRWKNPDGVYEPIGKEFHLLRDDKAAQDDSLYLRFRLKLTNLNKGLKADTPLLSFSLFGLRGGQKVDTVTVVHANLNNPLQPQKGLTTSLTYADYLRVGSPRGYFTYELRVSYTDLNASRLMYPAGDNYGQINRLSDLNPHIHWFGDCDMYLDYIEIEDQVHKNIRTNPDLAERVNARLEYLKTKLDYGKVIRYSYAFDEPKQPMFDSYRLLQNALKPSSPPLLTAIYPNGFRNYLMKPKAKDLAAWYYHQQLFRSETQPLISCPDPYPILDHTSWNLVPGTPNEFKFIQNMIEERVLAEYRNVKNYCLAQAGRQFIPIVQCAGEMHYSSYYKANSWSWQLPPYEMQKCLKYLPLCYGPDGILDFMIAGLQNTGLGYFCALNYEKTAKDKWDTNTFTFRALREANARTLVYGNLIRDLQWVNADSLRLGKNPPWLKLKPLGLDALQIINPKNGPYQGYIQCGAYQDAKKSYSLMLVNRRTNYLKSGSAEQLYPNQYADSFITAAPQSVLFKFAKEAAKLYGTHPALYDPYDSTLTLATKGQLVLVLPAGEGKLLQLVGSLTPKVKGRAQIRLQGVLQGEIELCDGAEVSFGPDSQVTLLPGTTLIVRPGASLVIKGECHFGEQARIINEGTLDMDGAVCVYDRGAGIVQSGTKLAIQH